MLILQYPGNIDDIEAVRCLMKTYASSLNMDLGFQSFDKELAELPGKYAPPSGYLLLAKDGDRPVGCVAARKIDDRQCEMKRLYVIPEYRGCSAGKILAQAIIKKAREIGYAVMKLETQQSMGTAVSLYRRLGFVETEAYTYNPAPDVVYLELSLRPV